MNSGFLFNTSQMAFIASLSPAVCPVPDCADMAGNGSCEVSGFRCALCDSHSARVGSV